MLACLLLLPEHRLAWARLEGQVVLDDLLAMLTQVVEAPRWEVGGHLVVDLLGVGSLVVDLSDLDRVSRFADEHMARIGEGGTTVIVSDDEFTRAVGRLFAAQRRFRGRTVRVVRSLAAAEALLDVPPGTLTPAA